MAKKEIETNKNGSTDDSKRQSRKRRQRTNKRNTGHKLGPIGIDSVEATSGHQKAYNDPQWYAKTPQLLRDAASYPFNVATGNALNITSVPGYYSDIGDKAPGIMTIDIIPHMGISSQVSDPVNVAATSLLSFIVHANSRNLSYNRSDVMLAIGAADSFFCFVNWCQRLYGIAHNPRQWNRYTAGALVRANGVNYSDILANLNDFRSWLNQLIIKGSAIWVPNTLPVLRKHSWMFSNVYKDASNEQAQLYMFTPALFYKFDETTSSQGGSLRPIWISEFDNAGAEGVVKDSDLLTFAQIREMGESMIQAILDSEDIQVIFGDILKAYGENSLFRLVTIDESYSIDPTYNEEVLMEIANSFAIPRPTTFKDVNDEYSITQDVNKQILVYSPNIYTVHMGYEMNKLINFDWDSVSPENLMVATRLVPSIANPTTEGAYFKYKLLSAGTELVAGYRIYSLTTAAELFRSKRFDSVLYRSDDETQLQYRADSGYTIARIATAISSFDWHPTIYCIYNQEGFGVPSVASKPSTQTRLDGMLADLCNANSIACKDLMNLDYTALLSEFDVPI